MVEAMPVGGSRASSHRQLPEEVATYVRELILSGAVRPGEFLRMDRIAEAVEVSNTPVREGLLSLQSEGFVRQVPRRGFVVAPFTPQDVRDLFWAQALLAGELASRAAKLMTTEQLDHLDALVADYDVAIERRDAVAIDELGHQFHRQINLAADSHRLALVLGSVVRQLPNRFYATIEGQVEATHADHPVIVEALRRRQGARARKLMQQHLELGADRLIDSLRLRGMWSE